MDDPRLPEPLRARIAELEARPALEKVRHFLRGYVADSDGLDEIRDEVRRSAQTSTHFLRLDLAAFESVLAETHSPGTLLRLVEGDGNRGLDDSTDAGAAAYLGALADLLREVIGE
ncbi:hypothetical protein [Paractinoplanes rishiriensis]|uniref:Uncharacterized protein n=1 Tax=Paractinoplanes rishiriensis TaxID=1050105 RepID=A0A919K3B7_9ACTN|nr:hypothetical protein [Actinoplanes rishiriensis]GIF00127.1 hypothetical protein Ari01nite_75910 [Actinoplanes rishiriensis]